MRAIELINVIAVETAEIMKRILCELPSTSRCSTPSGTGQLVPRVMAGMWRRWDEEEWKVV